MSVPEGPDSDDAERMTPYYNYSEPFNCECRAFARLQEAGYEELAVKCFGYVLLDEEHERIIMEQFGRPDFVGSERYYADDDLRLRFVEKAGKSTPPPIRGIVKEFGERSEDLTTRKARKILKDVTQLHQLGIFGLDVGLRQYANDKIADFSTAITVPHYLTTPELNPHLGDEVLPALEYETFKFAMSDYWTFDSLVSDWNSEHEKISVYAMPGGRVSPWDDHEIGYNLRMTPARNRIYTLVDPRSYDWKAPKATEAGGKDGRRGKKGDGEAVTKGPGGAVRKSRPRLLANPPKWYYDGDSRLVARLKDHRRWGVLNSIDWESKDGLLYPQGCGWRRRVAPKVFGLPEFTSNHLTDAAFFFV